MNDVSDKLKSLRERAGLSIRQMAAEAGMESSSSYNHYEKRFKAPYLPRDKAEAFAEALAPHGVDRREVMALAGVPTGLPAVTEAGVVVVPVYDIAASAGPGTYVDYEMQIAQLSLPRDYLKSLTSTGPDQLAIIRVKGDSMEPTLRDGDIVLVDRAKTSYGFDGLFVIQIDGTLHVKRLARSGRNGVVSVLSDNPLYPSVEYARSDVEIIGKVRWRGGPMG